MRKLERWWENLNEYIQSCSGKGIDWDTFDCCQFICECCKAISGEDPYKQFGYKYNTKSMAIKAVKAFASTKSYNKGILYIVKSIGESLGAVVVDRPQRGDIVVVSARNSDLVEYICGVVLINQVALIDEQEGLKFIPLKECEIKNIMRIPS